MTTNTHHEQVEPLTEAAFYILLSLAAGPKHGYAIMKDVQELSRQRIVMSTGTLYGAIKRFLAQQWIVRMDDEPTTGRQQKAYMLTELGHRVLAGETERLQLMLRAAQGRRVMEST